MPRLRRSPLREVATKYADRLQQSGLFDDVQIAAALEIAGQLNEEIHDEQKAEAAARMRRVREQRSRTGETPKDRSGNDYAFVNGIIRLNERDLNRWMIAYSHLDVRGELSSASLARWAAGTNNWFQAISGYLSKKNREARDRAIEAEARGRHSANHSYSSPIR